MTGRVRLYSSQRNKVRMFSCAFPTMALAFGGGTLRFPANCNCCMVKQGVHLDFWLRLRWFPNPKVSEISRCFDLWLMNWSIFCDTTNFTNLNSRWSCETCWNRWGRLPDHLYMNCWIILSELAMKFTQIINIKLKKTCCFKRRLPQQTFAFLMLVGIFLCKDCLVLFKWMNSIPKIEYLSFHTPIKHNLHPRIGT